MAKKDSKENKRSKEKRRELTQELADTKQQLTELTQELADTKRQLTGLRKMGLTRRQAISEILDNGDILSTEESRDKGKQCRKSVPRSTLGNWQPADDRPDAATLIFSQDQTRVPELVPIRHERMSVSPFAFYRGAALVMASDLANLPTTGIEVQLCGDAHISNFGLFLSPERRTVFDINDFDETCRGPWEWDVARLAASIEICGLDRGFSRKQRDNLVLKAVRTYRESMLTFAEMGNLDVWYAHVDIDDLLDNLRSAGSGQDNRMLEKGVQKSKAKNSTRAITKLTEVVDGHLRVRSDPPLIVPLREMEAGEAILNEKNLDMAQLVQAILAQYRTTLPPERSALVKQYHGMDIAHKVVGVGSVGTRALIVVLEGANENDPLVLQIKEATHSVVEQFVGKASQANHGQRVVEGQHAMQTVSDILLGWTTLPMLDGKKRDFYVRQLWDGKGSIDLSTISLKLLKSFVGVCGSTLARAHARTGNRHAIAAYLGESDKFDQSMLKFARTYAQLNQHDYDQFRKAIAEQHEVAQNKTQEEAPVEAKAEEPEVQEATSTTTQEDATQE